MRTFRKQMCICSLSKSVRRWSGDWAIYPKVATGVSQKLAAYTHHKNPPRSTVRKVGSGPRSLYYNAKDSQTHSSLILGKHWVCVFQEARSNYRAIHLNEAVGSPDCPPAHSSKSQQSRDVLSVLSPPKSIQTNCQPMGECNLFVLLSQQVPKIRHIGEFLQS